MHPQVLNKDYTVIFDAKILVRVRICSLDFDNHPTLLTDGVRDNGHLYRYIAINLIHQKN